MGAQVSPAGFSLVAGEGVMRMNDRKQRYSVGDLMTVQGAAQALGLTYWQVDRLIRQRKVTTIRVGNTRLVRLADVELAS
jgi:excisionase family DNA binding protein